MVLIKQKTLLALLVVLSVAVGLSLSQLPGILNQSLASKKELEIKAVDYHSTLEFSLGSRQKLDELVNVFSELVFNRGFRRVNIILTDAVQPKKIFWLNSKNNLVNHLGYDVQISGRSLDIYLYNNWAALSESGWDAEKIQRENELLLIRALLDQRGLAGKALENQVKETYSILQKSQPQALFYITYAL